MRLYAHIKKHQKKFLVVILIVSLFGFSVPAIYAHADDFNYDEPNFSQMTVTNNGASTIDSAPIASSNQNFSDLTTSASCSTSGLSALLPALTSATNALGPALTSAGSAIGSAAGSVGSAVAGIFAGPVGSASNPIIAQGEGPVIDQGAGAAGAAAGTAGADAAGAVGGAVGSAVGSIVGGVIGSAASVPVHPDMKDTTNKNFYSQQSSIFFKNCILDGIAVTMAKTIIKSLTGSIVNWVNSGFNGNPAFVQNVGAFMGGVADSVAGQYISQIAPQLCSPFSASIQLALAGQQTTQDSLSCTLTDAENNLFNATGGTGGSWSSWFDITQNAQNNPYGASMLAAAQMNLNIESAQGKYQQQLDWGKGFLSSEDCPQNVTADNSSVNSVYQSGGNPSSVTLSNGDMLNSTGVYSASGQQYYTKSTTSGTSNQIYTSDNQPVYGVSAGNNGCLTKTPGSVIESQLENTLGSDLRGLELAQSMDQIFSALVGQLVSKALGGVGGLLGH